MSTRACEIDEGFRSVVLSDDNFWPPEPKSIRETGLSGRNGANGVGLPVVLITCAFQCVLDGLLPTEHHGTGRVR